MVVATYTILHGYTHTIAGAVLIGAAVAITGKPTSEFVLAALEIPHHPLSWLASCIGAFVGAFSHIVLDAIMHSDMRPWWPLTSNNTLLGYIPLWDLHVVCRGLGLIGGLGVWLRVAGRLDSFGR